MKTNLQLPTDEQRLAVRNRPSGSPLMHQTWNDLLFLHWRMKTSAIQSLLPDGLVVDSFEGDGFIGIVPFFMKNIRFRGTPAVPWVSNFLELNVRTYVVDRNGRPGVWFFSLDCNQPLAVWAARALFYLPYHHASMLASFHSSDDIDYSSIRQSQRKTNLATKCSFAFNSKTECASPGTLEFFLAERYLLFSLDRKGQLLRGQVSHCPYPLCEVDVTSFQTDLFELNGLVSPGRPFDHAIGSRGVNVEVFALERV